MVNEHTIDGKPIQAEEHIVLQARTYQKVMSRNEPTHFNQSANNRMGAGDRRAIGHFDSNALVEGLQLQTEATRHGGAHVRSISTIVNEKGSLMVVQRPFYN